MEEKDYSPVNIKNRITTVRTFYNEFEIQLPKQKNKSIKQIQRLEDLPGKDDIIHALKFADLKYQSIILLMACSGMGESEICNLKYSDFLKSIETYVNDTSDIEEIETNRIIRELVTVNKSFSGGIVALQIIDPMNDPLIDPTQTPLAQSALPDTQNTTLQLGIAYKSPTAKELILRVLVQSASGTANIDVTRIQQSFQKQNKLI
jgi:hypothetical protein